MMNLNETLSESRAQSPLWQLLFVDIVRVWLRAVTRHGKVIYNFISRRSLVQLVFLATNLGLMIFAAPHWISYQVTFQEMQTHTLGSDMRIFFFLAGALGLIFSVFPFRFAFAVYISYLLAMGVFYCTGFFVPEWVHADFRLRSDLQFQLHWMLAWGGCLVVSLVLARHALEAPFVDHKTLAAWFFEIRTLQHSSTKSERPVKKATES